MTAAKPRIKIFDSLEAEELEKQLSNYFATENINEIIDIKFYQKKISKVVDMFEVEVDTYTCILLYKPLYFR